MREVLIEVAKDEIAGIYLQYVILCTEDPCISDRALNMVYSLLVIKSYGKEDRETLFVYDISRCKERAVSIARAMCNNTVTPCTVHEILDDIL